MEKKMEFHNEFNTDSFEKKEFNTDKIEIIAITDTHNDVEAITRNLRLYEVIDENGEWKEGVKNIRIMHTGDVINKRQPDKKSLEYIVHLKNTAPESCAVEILAGNHEIEYLMHNGGKAKEVSEMELIANNMSFLSESGPALFVHGHPSRTLLKLISSEGLKAINEEFKEVMKDAVSGNTEKINRFAFKKKSLKEGDKPYQRKVVHNDPHSYYKVYGKEIQKTLLKLGYRFVVHGHASQQSGVQNIDEFREMPEITFINNDVCVSEHKDLEPGETAGNKWGSLKISMSKADKMGEVEEITVVNKNTYTEVEKETHKKDHIEMLIGSLMEDFEKKGKDSFNTKIAQIGREDLISLARGLRQHSDESRGKKFHHDFTTAYDLVCERLDDLEYL